MKIISRKRKRQTAFITTLFICSFVSFFSQIQCASNNIRLFARSVPFGYQPPPTPPLVEDVPVMQYKLYKPPSRFSHPSTNNLPTFKHVGDKEPLMVNTLIQVFGPNKGDISESEKQRLSSFMGEEGKSIEQNSPITTPPPNLNGQKRVTITRQLDTEGRTYVPENQTNSTTNPKIAIVKAFAASNSSQISEAQLREELGKELEQSVSLILDELGRKDKSKQHITSTQPVPTGEELERLEGEENEGQTTERSQKESENSILSTREAITEQQPSSISSSTVPPLLVFSKTKEPIEVLPATSITTAQNKKEEENISTVTPGDNEEQKEEIATTIETQTEENIVESKSTTITIAQLYKNSEEKIEAPIATTNAEEIQLTSTKNIKPEENELNKENQETPKEEENKGLVIEGSIIKSEKKTTTTTEEIGFAEEEIPSTELAPSAEEQKATEELTKTTSETLQNTENIQNIKEEEEEEIKEQQKTTNINVGGEQQQQQLGPGWQRTDFEEGQLWVQCKPPSIRALLWPWPSNRTFENGVLFAKDYHEESDCYAELDKDSGGGARLDIGPGKCGLSKNNNSQTPQNISVVLMFAPRRSLVIEGPEFSFLVQCYTPVLPIQQKYQQLTADLAIQKPLSNPVMTKTIELSQTPPRCEYSLRKNSPDGPLLQRATLGQTIYHRWECEGGQEVAEQFGLLLSDCVVANLTQESINNNNSSSSGKTSMVDLIDSEGCSTDTLIVNDPEYEKDNLVAYAKAKVFLLRPESHFLRFSCKLSLCLRQNDGCKGFTPPKCPPTNVSRLPSNNHHSLSEKTPSALSQQLISPQLVVNSEGITSSSSNTSPPRLPFHSSGGNKYLLVNSAWTIGLVLGVSILLGLFFGLATFLLHSQHRKNQQKRLVQWVLARPPSSSSSSSSQEAGYIGSRGINIEAIQQHSDDYLSTEENIRINTTTINSFPSCSSNSPKERNNN